jgi:hypothetical protein
VLREYVSAAERYARAVAELERHPETLPEPEQDLLHLQTEDARSERLQRVMSMTCEDVSVLPVHSRHKFSGP